MNKTNGCNAFLSYECSMPKKCKYANYVNNTCKNSDNGNCINTDARTEALIEYRKIMNGAEDINIQTKQYSFRPGDIAYIDKNGLAYKRKSKNRKTIGIVVQKNYQGD